MKTLNMQAGVHRRFLEDVERRAKAIGKTPQAVCVFAGLSVNTWRSWAEDGASPTAVTMDKVLGAIAELEGK